jgi:hypothetical protein
MVTQLIKKLSTLYGCEMFISVFTAVHHFDFILSQLNLLHTITHHNFMPVFLMIIGIYALFKSCHQTRCYQQFVMKHYKFMIGEFIEVFGGCVECSVLLWKLDIFYVNICQLVCFLHVINLRSNIYK